MISPESIQEVIHRHTSHFTPVRGRVYGPDQPKVPIFSIVLEIREALEKADNELIGLLKEMNLPEEQYRESLRDIHNAIAERRHELF